MKRPGKRATRGLLSLAGVVGAGTCDDILGFDYEQAAPDERQRWRDIEEAVEWIKRECHEERNP